MGSGNGPGNGCGKGDGGSGGTGPGNGSSALTCALLGSRLATSIRFLAEVGVGMARSHAHSSSPTSAGAESTFHVMSPSSPHAQQITVALLNRRLRRSE